MYDTVVKEVIRHLVSADRHFAVYQKEDEKGKTTTIHTYDGDNIFITDEHGTVTYRLKNEY